MSTARTKSRRTNGNGDAVMRAAAMRALESVLVGRQQFAAQTGLSFYDVAAGAYKRSMNDALGYEMNLAVKHYRARFERGGIAQRIVDMYPKATWIAGADVQEIEDVDKETKFEKAVDELFERLNVWKQLQRADILAGIGRYGVLLIGADGDWASPLGKISKPEGVLYLATYAEDRAGVEKIVDNPKDERFGLPEFYTISAGTATSVGGDLSGGMTAGQSKRVHWSRIIHVAEGCLEDDVYGIPRMRPVWNYLDDLAKIVGGGAEAAWRRMDPGLHINVDPEQWAAAKMDTTAEEALQDQIDEYTHNLRRTIQTVGTEVNPLSASVTPFGANTDAIIALISATTGIPQRLLMGSERGELASSQDRDNWSDRVMERRRSFAEPLVKAFLQRLIDAGALPKPKEIKIIWPESEQLSDADKATMVSTIANANAAMAASGEPPIMTSEEIRDRVYDLDPLDIEEPELEEPADGVQPPVGEPVPPPAKAGGDGAQGAAAVVSAGAMAGHRSRKLRAAAPGLVARRKRSAKAVLDVADRFAPKVERAFRSAFVAAQRAVDMEKLEAAIRRGDHTAIEDELSRAVLDFAERVDEELPARLAAAAAEAG